MSEGGKLYFLRGVMWKIVFLRLSVVDGLQHGGQFCFLLHIHAVPSSKMEISPSCVLALCLLWQIEYCRSGFQRFWIPRLMRIGRMQFLTLGKLRLRTQSHCAEHRIEQLSRDTPCKLPPSSQHQLSGIWGGNFGPSVVL